MVLCDSFLYGWRAKKVIAMLKVKPKEVASAEGSISLNVSHKINTNGWWSTRQQGNEDLWNDPEMTPKRWLDLAYEAGVSQDPGEPHSADILPV